MSNQGKDDIDRTPAAFERLNAVATAHDLPKLVAALGSPKTDFWIRELLSEPIGRLGGVVYLNELFDALVLNYADGHDNDGFCHNLTEIAHFHPEACRKKLKELIQNGNFRHVDHATWLLDFCETRS